MPTRDEFSAKTKMEIAARAGFRCADPECLRETCGPCVDPKDSFNIGVASHIAAASVGGPRYDEKMTTEERKHANNGIWMCQSHGKQIDDDVIRYTPDLLRKWKKEAEDRQRARMGTPVGDDGTPAKFVEISMAERYGLNGQIQLPDGAFLPFATVFDVTIEPPTLFASISFVLRFMIQKAAHVPSIMMCDLRATVYEFEKLPEKYTHFSYAYPQRVYPYILDLAVPDSGRPRPCLATHYYPLDQDQPTPFTPLLITEDCPVIIDVRFNAPTSGVYSFALDVVIANEVHRHTFRVFDRAKVLFEKWDELHPEEAEMNRLNP